ncbi:MAG: SDR family NAD(P)-dependent oxidoreductase [Opitutaceae bacterium]
MSAARVSDFYRTAFVTGASTGLGRAFAEMLMSEGVRVWGTSRDPRRLEPLATAFGALFFPVALELRNGPQAEEIFLAADRDAGGFDIVVNNAGFGLFAEFAATDFALWHDQIDVMLVQPARLSRAALRAMLDRPGHQRQGVIVNISSIAAEFPLPFQSAYNVAKAGLSALSESLMAEVAGSKIAIIDFRPGDYRTEIEHSVRRPQGTNTPRMARAWAAFEAMMRVGLEPTHAARALRRALLRRRSATVRTGRFFQAVFAPFLARFGSLALKRRMQARYFDAS